MISMIVNKLLFVNRGIIGNLKAQGYGTGTIAFLLLSCFLLLMFVIVSLSLITSWIFAFILNITYQGFLEFTTYISILPWWLIAGTVFITKFSCLCICLLIYYYWSVTANLSLVKTKSDKKTHSKNSFFTFKF